MSIRNLLIAGAAIAGLSLFGQAAYAGAGSPSDVGGAAQPGSVTILVHGHGHGHGGGHHGGGHHGGFHHGGFHHGGHWGHGRRGYWRGGRWYGGGGSCYWNCINAGYGPGYCSVNSWEFCY